MSNPAIQTSVHSTCRGHWSRRASSLRTASTRWVIGLTLTKPCKPAWHRARSERKVLLAGGERQYEKEHNPSPRLGCDDHATHTEIQQKHNGRMRPKSRLRRSSRWCWSRSGNPSGTRSRRNTAH